MNVNRILNEIAKGTWAMSFDGLKFWGPFAHKIMSGEKFNWDFTAGSLMRIYDANNRPLVEDEDGNIVGDIAPGSVAIINMEGPLVRYGDWCTHGTEDIVRAMRSANNNPNIVAIVLYVNSPGGSVGAIPPFIEYKAEKKKPIVAIYEDCLSAAMYGVYEVADYVMAENDLSAQIGSCGIVLSFKDSTAYLESQGFKFHEVYPDESSDKNLPFLHALKGDYDLIKSEMLSPLAIKFQDAVKAARKNLDLSVKGVLTGATFFTDQAIKAGLTDSKGSLTEAIARARMLGEMNHYKNY